MYPQPDTVRNLGLKIITKGFNQSEANHEGVSVEEMPFCERAKHGRSGGLASEDLPRGTIVLPPCVLHTSRVHDNSIRPHRVPIVVTEKPAVADAKPDTRRRMKGICEPKRAVHFVHPELLLNARREQGTRR